MENNDHSAETTEKETPESSSKLKELIEQIEDEEIRQALQKENALKLKALEKLEKAQAEKLELSKKLEEKSTNSEPLEEKESPSTDSSFEDKVELRIAGFSKEEVAYMESFAKGRGISLAEASKDPFIAGAIESAREKAKAEASNLEPSSPSGENPKRGNSYSDIQKMSTAEKNDYLKSVLKKGRSANQNT